MKPGLISFKRIVCTIIPTHLRKRTQLEPQQIKRLLRGIMTAHADEIACDECFQQLDRFVEVSLAGKDVAEAMPLVKDHLERCKDCREEFELLLAALRTFA